MSDALTDNRSQNPRFYFGKNPKTDMYILEIDNIRYGLNKDDLKELLSTIHEGLET